MGGLSRRVSRKDISLGKEVLPFIYDDADPFSEGLECVGKWDQKTGQLLHGVIDRKGLQIVNFMYEEVGTDFEDGFCYVRKGQSLLRIINKGVVVSH